MLDPEKTLGNWQQQSLIFFGYFGLGTLYGYAIDLVDPTDQPQSGVAVIVVCCSALIAAGCFASFLRGLAKARNASKRTIIIPLLAGSLCGILLGFATQKFVLAP